MRGGNRFRQLAACLLALLAAGCDETAVPPVVSGGSTAAGRGENSPPGGRPARPEIPFDIFAGRPEPKLDVRTIERAAPTSAGEALETLEAIRKTFDSANIPEVLKPPYTPDAVRTYLETVTFLTEQRKKDLAWLQALEPAGVTADKFEQRGIQNQLQSVQSRLEESLPKELGHTTKYSRDNFAASLRDNVEQIQRGAEANPASDYDVANILANERMLMQRAAAVDRVGSLFQLAVLFDERLGFDAQWPDRRQEIQDLAARSHTNLIAAAAAVRPPQDVGDAELTAIAVKVLTAGEHKLPKAERIIVYSGRQRDNRRVEHVVAEGIPARITRRWDSFQAATIERGGDGRYYLYSHDVVYYHEGPDGVPGKQWVVGRRFQVAPILRENFGK